MRTTTLIMLGKTFEMNMLKHPDLNVKESEISRQIQDFLEYNGCLVIRLNNAPIPLPGGKGYRRALRRGLPDLVAFIPRRKGFAIPVMLEIKSKAGRTSKEQEQFLADADLHGVVCLVAKSLEFVQEKLSPYLKK